MPLVPASPGPPALVPRLLSAPHAPPHPLPTDSPAPWLCARLRTAPGRMACSTTCLRTPQCVSRTGGVLGAPPFEIVGSRGCARGAGLAWAIYRCLWARGRAQNRCRHAQLQDAAAGAAAAVGPQLQRRVPCLHFSVLAGAPWRRRAAGAPTAAEPPPHAGHRIHCRPRRTQYRCLAPRLTQPSWLAGIISYCLPCVTYGQNAEVVHGPSGVRLIGAHKRVGAGDARARA